MEIVPGRSLMSSMVLRMSRQRAASSNFSSPAAPLHPGFQGPGQLRHASLEEKAGVLDVLAVIGFGDQADARRRTELEVVFEAGPLAAAEDGVLAAADPEVLVDEMDGRPGPVGRAERAEVARSVRLDLAAEIDAGKVLAGRHLEIGEALVVLEPEVEAGLMLLDVVVLEEGGFFLGAGQDVSRCPPSRGGCCGP